MATSKNINVPESIYPAVQILINASLRDYDYVLCVESPVKSTVSTTGKNRITATNKQGLDLARMLGRFERSAREGAQ